MKKTFFVLVFTLLFLYASPIIGQDICDCNDQIADLIERIEVLETQVQTLTESNPGLLSNTPTYSIPDIDMSDGSIDGSYIIKYNRFELVKDFDDNNVVTIYYQLYNPSTETQDFSHLSFTSYQNGAELSTPAKNLGNKKLNLYPDCDTKIRPNATFECHTSFIITDNISPVEIEISDKYNSKKEKDIVLFVLDITQHQK